MEKNATRLYLEAAQEGDYVAQIELARRYDRGIGVDQDDEAALHWLLQSKASAPTEARLSTQFGNASKVDLTPLHHAVKQNDTNSIRNRRKAYKHFANVGDKNN